MHSNLTLNLKKALKGSLLIFISTVISACIWLMIKILITKNTTPGEFGVYSLVIAVCTSLVAFAGLGIPQIISKSVSESIGRKDPKAAAEYGAAMLQINFLSGLAFSIAVYASAPRISKSFFYMPELEGPLRAGSACIFIFVMIRALIQMMIGYGNARIRAHSDILTPLLFLAFVSASFHFKLPFISVIYSYVLSIAAAAIYIWIYWASKYPTGGLLTPRPSRMKEISMLGAPLVLASVTNAIIGYTDTIMIGRYLGQAEVGMYNVSLTIANFLPFGLNMLSIMFLPIAGDLYGQGRLGDLKRVYQLLTKWGFTITVPLFFVVLLFPEMTITLLFGEKFLASAPILQILALSFLPIIFIGDGATILIVFGLTESVFRITFIAALMNLALNYVFLKHLNMGVAGAATATAVTRVAMSLMSLSIVYRKTRFHPITASYLRPTAFIFVMGGLVYLAAKVLPFHILLVPVYFLVFAAGYAAALLLSRSIDKEEIRMLEIALNKINVNPAAFTKALERFTKHEPEP